MTERRKVFIVDDHPLVREWLSTLINRQEDLAVTGEAEDESGALAGIAAKEPDLAIVDISLKGGSGLELIKRIVNRHPQVAVIVLTMHDEALYAERAFRAGARGYVMKQESTKNVVAAIHCVLEGKTFWSERAATILEEKTAARDPLREPPQVSSLSDRELEVFELIGEGKETREIAERLGINFKTVQAYCARIKEKLGLGNATELLREAIRWHERGLRQ